MARSLPSRPRHSCSNREVSHVARAHGREFIEFIVEHKPELVVASPIESSRCYGMLKARPQAEHVWMPEESGILN